MKLFLNPYTWKTIRLVFYICGSQIPLMALSASTDMLQSIIEKVLVQLVVMWIMALIKESSQNKP